MARALRLAERGLYTTDPNPRVGCVLVRDGQVVGEGWHRRAGELHAERIALAAAGEAARGATAYVTLEPCAHHGRTPPCAQGLIEAGVSRVVAAMTDPNPLVAGGGLAMLRDAGVITGVGLLADDAERLNPGFLQRMRHGRPYVRCKLGMSLDGRTAMASGESQWITGVDARLDVQRLRARSSAVVTGVGSVLADDPSLNVRLASEQLPGVDTPDYLRQPLRVVLDTRLRTPPRARMLSLPGETLIVCGEAAPAETEEELRATGAEVLRLPQLGGRIELPSLMQALGARGINEVLVESGPTLAGSALLAGVVDVLIVYLAPHLLGHAARGLVNLPGLERLSDRVRLAFLDVRRVGADLRIDLAPSLRSENA
ncbi:MAG: bifunctional diaminohydroxyphosphoribosylaminopyrimidine deaminase/5-amino-6-(5-phosphoribosylamino)uracil reductase RibD [Gammaproteobacteria bacterium]|nr:bifunctional diaminohydroxyphosphoribosylaminopyrimidine deaminase/5-amino-6-(5-phosphoribosylamino)uracil reductase RibD [Gammaproteobacteria bacterium]MCP5415429.1 bifunctional diaminohydroxyphosphoribosylaminopyrimidine deaminase/5-amino-6-(5-phosphoribosylamino)uracil reductase RibD [Chromatiaceae bacterium]